MRLVKLNTCVIFIAVFLVSCFGDQKTVVGQEFGEIDFVNETFKGNKKDFADLPQSLCEFLSKDVFLTSYGNATAVTFDGKNSFMNKNCQFAVTFFDDSTQFIKGSIFINEDNSEDDNWKDSWEFKKKRFKSAEYIKNLGMAAIWIGKQRKLEIKMKGYNVIITIPPKMLAKNKLDNETNVKNIAVAVAKSTNLF